MAEGTKESHFEEDVVKYMSRDIVPNFKEYILKDTSVYDKELCLIPEDVIAFIKDTQPKKYQKLTEQYGTDTDKKIVSRLSKEIKDKKTLHVLREGIRDRGQSLKLAFFKPTHSKTPEHQEWYDQNRLTIIRQLKYSKRNENSIDIVIFINGLPVITMELKNALTGQRHTHAIKQYMKDRDPKEPLLEFQRCLVHFAVGTEKVSMCTELKGKSTFFLPFNKGLTNYDDDGFATSYLWKDVLTKDSLMDLVQNYINLQVDKEKVYDIKTKQLKEKTSKKLIFPRFHQRRAVEKLIQAIRTDGVGGKYLIQHSAGSGKSNTIAWLAHRLSDFYRNPEDAKALYSSVIVVTDRRVLDRQIQENIRQFEQTPGTVAYIDKNKTSQDLREAIESNKRVIVTTLQKFPVISDIIGQNKDKTYAVIIDEAHSSQSGESARHLRKSLSLEEAETKDVKEKNVDEIIEEEIQKKGDQTNISFFAFTATPKDKTIELFGTIQPDGSKKPFDTYSMEQAIKEGFIKDVLKNYMSWRRYYKLVKRTEIDDKEYEKKKTVRVLSSFVDLQDHAIEKKTRVMLEHFVSQTAKEIQGKARAMLVTKSRLHAVRFKRKFDEVMREMKLPYDALVAFSGTVTDSETGEDYTMQNMNNLGGRISVPDAFKLPQHRILIVANMFQTGFDEPLLHTMFVDKKLGGASSVQTLSRLNRNMKGKDSTMVLDFVNDPEKIQEDFQKYYGGLYMEADDQTDPNSLYDILHKIESFDLVLKNEILSFAEYFFKKGDHKEKLQPILNIILKRYKENLDEDRKLDFKASLKSFVRLYRFLSQIITFSDVELEKWYVLSSALFKKLPTLGNVLPTEVLEEVNLESYKLQHQFTADLQLESADASMTGMQPGGGTPKQEEDYEWLTRIIKVLNETFGLDLSEEDKVDFEKMKENIYANEELMTFFNDKNSKDNIKDRFEEEIDNELLNFINTKLDFYNKLTEDKVNYMFKKIWFNDLYDRRVRGIERK
jgi:type I restriction enzyme R subunit